jgi:hypothetical protein
VHPAGIEVYPLMGKLHWRATHAELILNKVAEETLKKSAVTKNRRRGITISLRLFCEEGAHVWDMIFEFYKGYTYVTTKNIDHGLDDSGWANALGVMLDTIWRN